MSSSTKSPLRAAIARNVGRGALLVALLVAGLAVRAWASCSDELDRGRIAAAAGDREAAIDHYRRAAVWYFPGNTRARHALEALIEIGEDAEGRGDATLALAAFRSVHAATMSSRHLLVPHDDLRRHADERIATLMAEGAVPPIDATRSPDERRAIYLAMLADDRDVSPAWALLALLGFAGWVSAAALFLGRGLDADGRPIPREARVWASLFLACLTLFAVALALA